jgi:hypothetical protein
MRDGVQAISQNKFSLHQSLAFVSLYDTEFCIRIKNGRMIRLKQQSLSELCSARMTVLFDKRHPNAQRNLCLCGPRFPE